ncbi:MAG TPA: cell wall hydrolase, partial [Candidatus Obscuribacterales bacterium]
MKPFSALAAVAVFILMIAEPVRADYIPEPPDDPYAIDVQDALTTRLTAVQCLALNIYHEARGESLNGQYAVAMVTLNRLASKHYPDSVCGVVLQAYQFTWVRDGRSDQPEVDSDQWRLAYNIAYRFMAGGFWIPWMGSLTHYHRHDVKVYWPRLRVAVVIGDHVFY